MNKFIKQVKGITLVALVVTIIVLLILAGIAINLTIGNNGLFSRAQNAANAWSQAEQNEQEEMKSFANIYDETLKNLGLESDNKVNNKKPIGEITGNEKENTETEDKNGNTLFVPLGFKVVNPDDTVNDGIVIEDVSGNNSNTVGNQFVWIPCTIDGVNGSLKYDRYAFTSDTWIYRQTKLEEKDEDGSYKIQVPAWSTTYYFHEQIADEEKASVEKYGGYYIGRYEVGKEQENAKIKNNLPVYNSVTRDESKVIAENLYKGRSRLCSSYAWDTALQFIGGTYAVETEGNYGGSIKDTGYHGEKNIYDMGGNAWEWTTETSADDRYPCVFRRRVL